MSPPRVWWVTTGHAGFRSQALGLVNTLGLEAEEKTIELKAPWSLLPPALWRTVLAKLDPAKDRLAPPWPDLIISCSRRAARVAIAVKRASGGQTLAVHIQNPLAPLDEFDLVVPMRHDRVSGLNVIAVDTALHDVGPAKLAAAADLWRSRLSHLPRPLTGVLLGGSTRQHPFTIPQAQTLINRLNAVRGAGGVVITPSRRTPEPVKALVHAAFDGDPSAWVWDGQGDNPYLGILALSDRLVATGDSVSMVSEAVASGRPTAVLDLGGGARHERFLSNLVERRIVSRLDGSPWLEPPAHPVNATLAVAEAVRGLLASRGFTAGGVYTPTGIAG
ncbi:MAG TPA: mitochondrial fission ELM1 family protein [Caulobacteraceae bacterium]|nr:mitochondrial fission ELM1 family protein [Caulobacteraceae bacterium]